MDEYHVIILDGPLTKTFLYLVALCAFSNVRVESVVETYLDKLNDMYYNNSTVRYKHRKRPFREFILKVIAKFDIYTVGYSVALTLLLVNIIYERTQH